MLQKAIGVAGVLFLLFYGYKAFRSAFAQQHDDVDLDIQRQQIPVKEVIIASLSISLLNPWALMDTMVIIGGGAAQYETAQLMIIFLLGSLTASTIWFSIIGFGSKKLKHFLDTPKLNKYLDITAGIVMWLAALYLTKTMVIG